MLDDLIAGTREAPGLRKILQFAAQHVVVSESDYPCGKTLVCTETRGLSRVAVEGRTTCGDSCSEHAAPMDPTVWSGLQEELLRLVFARLPLPQINRLRCLSREWHRNLNAGNSHFKLVCADAYPKLFALVTEDDNVDGVFWVNVFDVQHNTWHAFQIYSGVLDERVDTMSACDGGLVCSVCTSREKKNPVRILVCNPLTQDWVALPLHGMSMVLLEMVQLIMSDDKKTYKVLVVGQLESGLIADFFDSGTGEWTRADWSPDLVFGYQYVWDMVEDVLDGICNGPCAYDCQEGELLELSDNPLQGASKQSCALVKGHLFVLHEEGREDTENPGYLIPEYCITEFQRQKGAPNWIKLRDHSCSGFGDPPSRARFFMRLYACKGFLLVVASNVEGYTSGQLARLYDLSTGKWLTLPNLPGDREICEIQYDYGDLMCELKWE